MTILEHRNRATALFVWMLVGSVLSSCASTPGRDRALGAVMATALSADGRTIAVSTHTSEVALFDVKPLRFRQLLTREEAKTRPGVAGLLRSPPVAFSPDGKLLVAAGVAGEVFGWEADSGAVRFRVPAEAGVADLAFLPDGRSFVTAGPAPRHWSAESGSVLGEFKLSGDARATFVGVSPDGRVVLVGLASGEIAEFDAVTGRSANA